jgi:1-acyl-sn-glycerol-3-phosphate acyltransferase
VIQLRGAAYAVQWLRSALFIGQMYVAMLVYAIVWFIPALLDRNNAQHAIHAYCRWVRFTARVLCGLRSEIRGTPPTGEALIAAKHQSFFDIIMIVSAVPRPRFIMKSILKWAPLLGWYASRIGCIAVDRGKRGAAIKQMVEGANSGVVKDGQLIIYPQGTRVAPGKSMPYKVGTSVLYKQLGQSCVPVAANVGVFWPRHGLYRAPGLAVVEFLDPIAPGMAQRAFLGVLEDRIEGASDRLMVEAGFAALEQKAEGDD